MTALTPDEIRQLLRECVTVVKPGETLIIRGDRDWTPNQLRAVQDMLDDAIWHRNLGFNALIVPGEELGVAEAAPERDHAAWLKDIREDTFRSGSLEAVRLTHLPTGVIVDAPTRDEAIGKLAQALVSRGDISVNDARAAHGLRPWHPEPAMPVKAAPEAEDPLKAERRCPSCGLRREMTLEPAGGKLEPGCGLIRKWQCSFCGNTERFGP